MFFSPKEPTVTLIFSVLSYSALDGRGKRRKRQIFMWVLVRGGGVVFCLKLLRSVVDKPFTTAYMDSEEGKLCHWP